MNVGFAPSAQHRRLQFFGQLVGLLGDLAHQDGGGNGALPHPGQMVEKHQGEDNGDAHQGHVEKHLHVAEFHGGHLADGRHDALTGGGDQIGHHLHAHPQGDEDNAQGAVNPCLEVAPAGQRRDDPLRHVDGKPEENRRRELQNLEPVVLSA